MEFSNLQLTSFTSPNLKAENTDTSESSFVSEAFANIFSNLHHNPSESFVHKNISQGIKITKKNIFNEDNVNLITSKSNSNQKMGVPAQLGKIFHPSETSLLLNNGIANRVDTKKEAEIPSMSKLWKHMSEIVDQETIVTNNFANEIVNSDDTNIEPNPISDVFEMGKSVVDTSDDQSKLQDSELLVKNIFDPYFDGPYFSKNKLSQKNYDVGTSTVDNGQNSANGLDFSTFENSNSLIFNHKNGLKNHILFSKNILKNENFLNKVTGKKGIDDADLVNIANEALEKTGYLNETTRQILNSDGIVAELDNHNLIISDDIDVPPGGIISEAIKNNIENNTNAEKTINQNNGKIEKINLNTMVQNLNNIYEEPSISYQLEGMRVQEMENDLQNEVDRVAGAEKKTNLDTAGLFFKQTESIVEGKQEMQTQKTQKGNYIYNDKPGPHSLKNIESSFFDGNGPSYIEEKVNVVQDNINLDENTGKIEVEFSGNNKNSSVENENIVKDDEKHFSVNMKNEIKNGFERDGATKTEQSRLERYPKTNADGIHPTDIKEASENDNETESETENMDKNTLSLKNENTNNFDRINDTSPGSGLNNNFNSFPDKEVPNGKNVVSMNADLELQHEVVSAQSNEKTSVSSKNHQPENVSEVNGFEKFSHDGPASLKLSSIINKMMDENEAPNEDSEIQLASSDNENKRAGIKLNSADEKNTTTSDQTDEKELSFFSFQEDGIDLEQESIKVSVVERPHQDGGDKVQTAEEGRDIRSPEEKNILNQVVKKASLELKNNRSEIKIDIKPEHLGTLKIKVINDHQHVVAKIVAETAHVKEILEHNLNQLKSDLIQSGIHVDEINVSVDQDQSSHYANQQEEKWVKARYVQRFNRENVGNQQDEHREMQKHKGKTDSGVDYYA